MAAENPPLVLDRPMPPPAWALMERDLLRPQFRSLRAVCLQVSG